MKQKVKRSSLTAVELATITDMNLVEKGLKVGQKVQVKWDDGHWYTAKVLKVLTPTTYTIQYDEDKVKEDIDLENDFVKTANVFTPAARHERNLVIDKKNKPKTGEEWREWLTNTVDHARTSMSTNSKLAEHIFNQLSVWKAVPAAEIKEAKEAVFDLYTKYDNKNNPKGGKEALNKAFREVVKTITALGRQAGLNQAQAMQMANRMVSTPGHRVS